MNTWIFAFMEYRGKRRKKELGKESHKNTKSDLEKILEMDERSVFKPRWPWCTRAPRLV